jgi:hypothetical protein
VVSILHLHGTSDPFNSYVVLPSDSGTTLWALGQFHGHPAVANGKLVMGKVRTDTISGRKTSIGLMLTGWPLAQLYQWPEWVAIPIALGPLTMAVMMAASSSGVTSS